MDTIDNRPGIRMKYFVLKPHGEDEYAAASRRAMLTYARRIEGTDAILAAELRIWIGKIVRRRGGLGG